MKKYIVYFICICLFFISYNVEALEYSKNELIAVNESATVDTERFLYSDFIFNKQGNLTFNSIKNKTNSRQYVSINVLMFDKERKNIGFITYCSKRDYDSNYANYRIDANGVTTFNINISKRYFVDGKNINDVSYIAIMDENKYCQIGGYTKYENLTIEQINSGTLAYNLSNEGISLEIFMFLKNRGVIILIIGILILLISIIINGIILNALYKRMFSKTTKMAYIPFLNNYVAVKLAFGDLPAKIYLGCFILSLIPFIKIYYLLYIFNFISFIVVIIKLITKKYNLFYYGDLDGFGAKNTIIENKDNEENVSFINSNLSNSENANIIDDDLVNLNYEDENNKTFFGNDISLGNNNKKEESNINEKNNNDESDLSKFFR